MSAVIKYIDKATGEELSDKDIIKGHEGDTYKTIAKEILYYNLSGIPENAEGIIKVEVLKQDDGTEKINNKTTVVYYYEQFKFNLKVDKEIDNIIVNGEEKQIVDKDFTKVEIYRKSLDTTNVIIEYTIKVINDGELDGSAKIVDEIPSGFEMKEPD